MAIFWTDYFQDSLNLFLENEVEILHWCAIIMALVGAIVYVILLYIPATYGRYSSTKNMFLFHGIPARVAWFFQELPSFLVPVILICLVKFGILNGSYSMWQLLVLSCFVFHYFQRYLLFNPQ